jgi:hypothetical protein
MRAAFVVLLTAAFAIGAVFLLPTLWKRIRHRLQVAFIGKTLARRTARRETRLIASLSTLPDRIQNLRPSLECLLQQTRVPDEIVIAVPQFSIRQQARYVVPDWLGELPRVRVMRCERDWGAATKFIPVIQEELRSGRPDTLIMVVDDDRTYPLDAAQTYLHFHAQLPDAALCFRGARMPRTFDWRDARMRHGDRIRTPLRVAAITGCGSYLIQPRFFDEQLWNYTDAPAAAFYMDDIWISGWLDRRGVPKYVVPASDRMCQVPEQSRTMTLHEVPGGRQENNNEVIAFFRESWDVFAS